jgi:catechol 1,2-dioxygenase
MKHIKGGFMQHLTESSVTERVLERISDCPNPRLKQIVTALIEHLHEFAREVALTPEEWKAGIDFLTAAGHVTDEKRQEFILLSDTLGLSALVDIIKNRSRSGTATESSLLGPFYRNGAPELPLGASIAGNTPGESVLIQGQVRAAEGKPIAGALLDVWQAAPNGLYDLQDENQPEMNLRGQFRADTSGRFRFQSVKPASYPIPFDGPVGMMLRALGRHPYRPAHIHFIVSAPGYQNLITALYITGDPYLDSDAVFGSRESLVVGYRPSNGKESGTTGRETLEYDFVLAPAAESAHS